MQGNVEFGDFCFLGYPENGGNRLFQNVGIFLPDYTALGRGPRWFQVSHVGFVVDKMTIMRDPFDYFGFPCQFSLHSLLHIH
jgi:hypothetical protein